MSVFGSMFTAASGLNAQSQSLGMISNNIANVSTVGYKRNDAAFSSLVTSASRSILYSPGSVKATQNARIDLQGALQQSGSATDIALSGNGMFVVRATTDAAAEPLYTRAGSFSENSDGYLRNTAGYILQGWPLDQDGNLPPSISNMSSLVPVDVAFLNGLTQETSSAAMSASLDATQTVSGNAVDFSRSLTIYDSQGAPHDVTVNFTKLPPTVATATGTGDLSLITGDFPDATASFDVSVDGAAAVTVTLDGDVNQLLTDLNAIAGLDAMINEDGQLVIKTEALGETLDLTNFTGTPSAATTLGFASPTNIAAPASPAPIAGVTLADPENPEGWWNISYTTSTGTILSGAVNFAGGTLNAQTDVDGAVNLNLGPINWLNGSAPQSLTFDISDIRVQSSDYNVTSTSQNGTPIGFRTGVSIDEDGFVTAQFSNGLSRQVYKLAVATFPNVNGLAEMSGNVYRQSDTSGDFILREAGTGSAGLIASGALEGSNVDLADEFSKMIVTQRAYSANTKVINTADQMTAELLQLR